MSDFKRDGVFRGSFSLYDNLAGKVREENKPNEACIGYDFIGVEAGGSFHSFYCHGIGHELAERFSLQFNQYGLFEAVNQPKRIRHYLNDPEAAVEPVPWYIAKTKRVVCY